MTRPVSGFGAMFALMRQEEDKKLTSHSVVYGCPYPCSVHHLSRGNLSVKQVLGAQIGFTAGEHTYDMPSLDKLNRAFAADYRFGCRLGPGSSFTFHIYLLAGVRSAAGELLKPGSCVNLVLPRGYRVIEVPQPAGCPNMRVGNGIEVINMGSLEKNSDYDVLRLKSEVVVPDESSIDGEDVCACMFGFYWCNSEWNFNVSMPPLPPAPLEPPPEDVPVVDSSVELSAPEHIADNGDEVDAHVSGVEQAAVNNVPEGRVDP